MWGTPPAACPPGGWKPGSHLGIKDPAGQERADSQDGLIRPVIKRGVPGRLRGLLISFPLILMRRRDGHGSSAPLKSSPGEPREVGMRAR